MRLLCFGSRSLSYLLLALLLLNPGHSIAKGSFNYLPRGGNGIVVHKSHYTLSYSEDHEVSEWTAHYLTRELVEGNASRTDNYRRDTSNLITSVNGSAYRGSGYDRGHLVPAADMKLSRESMSESFFMSNMSPQVARFNRGVWQRLERQVRQWVRSDGNLYVVTGPVLRDDLPEILPASVSIPEYFYKIVYDDSGSQPKIAAFLMRNRGSREDLERFVVTVDQIEELTGIDFFPALPDRVENWLESVTMPDAWDWYDFSSETNENNSEH